MKDIYQRIYETGIIPVIKIENAEDAVPLAKALIETITGEMPLTGSRGGAVFISKGEIAEENPDYRNYLTITENGKVSFVRTKPVPVSEGLFEKYLNNGRRK